MKKFLPVLLAFAALSAFADTVLQAGGGTFTLNNSNGAIKKIVDNKKRTVLEKAQNRYIMMSKAGDATAYEDFAKEVLENEKVRENRLRFERGVR